ncbi:hypothetical protein AGMMS50293_27990 [Spirochaetia bacterium]|nr:hypothetical protein AGMMS50293_27990 [Spirochaetia bacterium]
MKNFIKIFGIIAIVAIIGIGLAGCKTDPDESGGSWPAELNRTMWGSFQFHDDPFEIWYKGYGYTLASGTITATSGQDCIAYEYETNKKLEFSFTITGTGDARVMQITYKSERDGDADFHTETINFTQAY